MSSYRIALNFEDGVTRIINCGAKEKVLDAAFRQRINLPMDCSDGVCGTCKCRAESGQYDLGDDYIDEALNSEEADAGMVLTCQMVPQSDCVIAVPVASTACKTGSAKFSGKVAAVTAFGEAAFELVLEVGADAPAFLPGQYVNIGVPGSGQQRAYSFSSPSGAARMSFLIKNVPGGLMSAWLAGASVGTALELTGPLGSFYLRPVTRPVLMLAGGTGLAPFLSMLEELLRQGVSQPVHMIYGVTRDQDLVLVERLEALAQRLPGFSFTTCVADPATTHPRQGYVTQHMPAEVLHDGAVDVYLCGPPPMVEAVQKHFQSQGITPASFHYEKFVTSQPVAVAA
ncbi:benzoate 1,2-dioxygenase electron transfer component BenC [Herbaspirillum rubrisubalbicans]|jgi:benzoate/toluate 1,2-dioxygenase reductase subunit|uniref:NADH oxidase n=1 Tax=Herbaspirillum rubrisubalbicans Os34 TaxID=1235827 RepID=A0A6M3ZR29_9BURK|nr:benzoate 1,2-dioxygenase electron transfer component BenC [Herbaspirillum rubrisubalbicans]NQE49047.1 NADH oxidase [Herbaspirillum rubrisubalbicans]QJP99891.1 NADH oxidase [Herbaspirillum rubrisubalbicans Os34]